MANPDDLLEFVPSFAALDVPDELGGDFNFRVLLNFFDPVRS